MRLRYLLILDFEATCDDSGRIVPRNEIEIIELPTLLYDVDEDTVHATFHEYVRPMRHPTLTPFCTQLTGIEQVCSCKIHTSIETEVLIDALRVQWTQRILSLPCGSDIKNFCGHTTSWSNLVQLLI